MNKNKLSYYASYIAINCGIFILIMRLLKYHVSNASIFMGFLFIGIGLIGLKFNRNV